MDSEAKRRDFSVSRQQLYQRKGISKFGFTATERADSGLSKLLCIRGVELTTSRWRNTDATLSLKVCCQPKVKTWMDTHWGRSQV